jgi:hypothetical protein
MKAMVVVNVRKCDQTLGKRVIAEEQFTSVGI